MKKDLKPEIDELDMLLLGSKRTHSQRSEDNEVYNFDRHKLPPKSISRAVPAALLENQKSENTPKAKKVAETAKKGGRLARDCKAVTNLKLKLDSSSTETEKFDLSQ